MEIVAHGLWAAAAAVGANRRGPAGLSVARTIWWAVFPDVLAFGPAILMGLWLWMRGRDPHPHLGVPLYSAGHSLPVFLLVLGLSTILARRVAWELFGWLMHILIDIPTHSFDYYATRFLWPISDFRVDGIAWWTRWFWISTYMALVIVYAVLWRKGWLTRRRGAPDVADEGGEIALHQRDLRP